VSKKPITLLIDADSLIYNACFGNEYSFDGKEYSFDFEGARYDFASKVKTFTSHLEADSVVIVLSDYEDPWRRTVLPTYKAHRADLRKPEGMDKLREWVSGSYQYFYQWPRLEGDDVLGILMTSPEEYPGVTGRRVCVSMDKDMMTVPGWHWSWKWEWGTEPVLITEDEANRYHMMQTLTGDPVDGYKGCPKIGPVKAKKILDGAKTPVARWKRVVEAYRRAGLTEADALTQAQVSRILHYGEYDRETREVRLWKPDSR